MLVHTEDFYSPKAVFYFLTWHNSRPFNHPDWPHYQQAPFDTIFLEGWCLLNFYPWPPCYVDQWWKIITCWEQQDWSLLVYPKLHIKCVFLLSVWKYFQHFQLRQCADQCARHWEPLQEPDTLAEWGMQKGYWGVLHVEGRGRRLDWAGGGIRSQCRSDKVSVSPTRGSWNKDEVKQSWKRRTSWGTLPSRFQNWLWS